MTDEEMRTHDLAVINQALVALGKHFDTVQVFVTRHEEPDGTVNVALGRGNWFARFGQVANWMAKTDAYEREEAIGGMEKDG